MMLMLVLQGHAWLWTEAGEDALELTPGDRWISP